MIYKLDNTLPAFGIKRQDYMYPFNAVVRASSTYLNKPLYTLMKYQKKGEYYLFEDEYVYIYAPGEPIKKTGVFIRMKPVYFTENEKAVLYLDSKLDGDYDSFNTSLSFRITFKNSGDSYVGCLITPQHYIEALNMVKKESEESELYLLDNFYEKIVKEINITTVQKLFKKISNGENRYVPDTFLKLRSEG